MCLCSVCIQFTKLRIQNTENRSKFYFVHLRRPLVSIAHSLLEDVGEQVADDLNEHNWKRFQNSVILEVRSGSIETSTEREFRGSC